MLDRLYLWPENALVSPWKSWGRWLGIEVSGPWEIGSAAGVSCWVEESIWAGILRLYLVSYLLKFLRVLVTSYRKIKLEMGSISCTSGIILDNFSEERAELEGQGCNPHMWRQAIGCIQKDTSDWNESPPLGWALSQDKVRRSDIWRSLEKSHCSFTMKAVNRGGYMVACW